MGEIKIIFFDIDGTLIDLDTGRVSQKTLETLKQLKDKSTILCLATGRSPMGLPHFDGVEFDAFLTFNGSYCFNRWQTIFSNPIPTEDVKAMIQNAASIHRPVSIATKKRLIANGTDADLEEYFSFSKLKIVVSDEFEDVAANDAVYQIMLGCRRDDYPQILQGTRNAKIAAWWDRAVDVIPADGGKGSGIAKVLSFYHLNRSAALAFGDGNNDIEMLQAVGHGVAMGNASKLLKEAADDVCAPVNEDGIYHYCAGHGLI